MPDTNKSEIVHMQHGLAERIAWLALNVKSGMFRISGGISSSIQ